MGVVPHVAWKQTGNVQVAPPPRPAHARTSAATARKCTGAHPTATTEILPQGTAAVQLEQWSQAGSDWAEASLLLIHELMSVEMASRLAQLQQHNVMMAIWSMGMDVVLHVQLKRDGVVQEVPPQLPMYAKTPVETAKLWEPKLKVTETMAI